MKEQSELKIGIHSETDSLKTVVTWGPLGTEASLAQLHDPTISLFFDDMNVLGAREEAGGFKGLLERKGVTVFEARNVFASLIPEKKLNKGATLNALLTKAEEIKGQINPRVKDEIVELVEQDIEQHGNDKALALNTALSLEPELPMGNIIFARDQMNVLLGVRFQSTMAYAIRKPEVEIYERVYQQGLGLPEPVAMPTGETFEGGDAYVHDGVVYVGVGARTTMGAAIHIYKTLQPQLEEKGFKFVIVHDTDVDRPLKEQMDFMHLDTFSMPIGSGQIMVCVEEGNRRKALQVSTYGGNITVKDTELSLVGFLEKQGQTIIPVPLEEQQYFGCNYLNLDEFTSVVPLDSNGSVIGQLEQAGKEVVVADLHESTKGYGGAHCMSGQLLRENE